MLSCECSCGFHSLLNTIFWPFAKLMKQKMRAPGRNRANQPVSWPGRQAGAGPSRRLVLTQNWHLNCWLLREIMCSCGCGLIQSECLSNPPSECRARRDNESRALGCSLHWLVQAISSASNGIWQAEGCLLPTEAGPGKFSAFSFQTRLNGRKFLMDWCSLE